MFRQRWQNWVKTVINLNDNFEWCLDTHVYDYRLAKLLGTIRTVGLFLFVFACWKWFNFALSNTMSYCCRNRVLFSNPFDIINLLIKTSRCNKQLRAFYFYLAKEMTSMQTPWFYSDLNSMHPEVVYQ